MPHAADSHCCRLMLAAASSEASASRLSSSSSRRPWPSASPRSARRTAPACRAASTRQRTLVSSTSISASTVWPIAGTSRLSWSPPQLDSTWRAARECGRAACGHCRRCAAGLRRGPACAAGRLRWARCIAATVGGHSALFKPACAVSCCSAMDSLGSARSPLPRQSAVGRPPPALAQYRPCGTRPPIISPSARTSPAIAPGTWRAAGASRAGEGASTTIWRTYGVGGIVPTWQLLRTATSWQRCGAPAVRSPADQRMAAHRPDAALHPRLCDPGRRTGRAGVRLSQPVAERLRRRRPGERAQALFGDRPGAAAADHARGADARPCARSMPAAAGLMASAWASTPSCASTSTRPSTAAGARTQRSQLPADRPAGGRRERLPAAAAAERSRSERPSAVDAGRRRRRAADRHPVDPPRRSRPARSRQLRMALVLRSNTPYRPEAEG